MLIKNIPYQSFCWVLGTTSFRTAKLNLKIEQQLLLLSEFYNNYLDEKKEWVWNNATQESYYDYMKERAFLKGDAPRKDKDAREKTSGLVDIGLIRGDRTITQAGYELLDIARRGDFKANNPFNIDKDSFVYFKQLLKTAIYVQDSVVRPYFVLVKALVELGYLSYDEFTYLLPLAISSESTNRMISRIKELRRGETTIEDVIFEDLMLMSNFQLANRTFMENTTTEELICLVGMNRKSRSYDRPYYELYNRIVDVFLKDNHEETYQLYLTAKKINQRPGALWRNLLFKTSSAKSIKNHGFKMVEDHCPFLGCSSEAEIKLQFFKYLHVHKAMATLSDYFDLNRRYFNLTDTLVFEDQRVRLDMIPKYYFEASLHQIYAEAFDGSPYLEQSVPLEQIHEGLGFDEDKIYLRISRELGVTVKTPEQAADFIHDERYQRFNQLINRKFTNSILLELLDCFEERNDTRIEELVTDEADIPTIFEYILGIIWYKVSEGRGDILDFMKLSLEANLLPKSHAAGGYADIIYEYEACQDYPKHSLLIEATLADSTNQRRMEMEPVSRHLGDYRIRYSNPHDYSLFISPYLHRNVVNDFRYRKQMPYYGAGDQHIMGMKIIPMDTRALKDLINRGIKYRYLYGVFEKYHELPLGDPSWHEQMIKEATKTV